jgi:hypothetical protein
LREPALTAGLASGVAAALFDPLLLLPASFALAWEGVLDPLAPPVAESLPFVLAAVSFAVPKIRARAAA